jgi:hypothetical protein
MPPSTTAQRVAKITTPHPPIVGPRICQTEKNPARAAPTGLLRMAHVAKTLRSVDFAPRYAVAAPIAAASLVDVRSADGYAPQLPLTSIPACEKIRPSLSAAQGFFR